MTNRFVKMIGVLRMNKLGLKWIAISALIGTLNAGNESLKAQDSGAEETTATSGSVEEIAASNGLLGYDHEKQFKKKLLGFVGPMYKAPLISDQLTTSIAVIKQGEVVTEERQKAADRMARAAASAMQTEQQARLVESSIRMQVFQDQGMRAPGLTSTMAAAGLAARSARVQAEIALLRDQLEKQKVSYEVAMEAKRNRMQQKLEVAKSVEIRPISAKSGQTLNILLDSMKDALLQYSYGMSSDAYRGTQIKLLKVNDETLQHIQLQIDDEGEPIVFSALGGTSQLGKMPLAMQHERILSTIKKIEDQLDALRNPTEDGKLAAAVAQLHSMLDELEVISNEVLGTSEQSARVGMQQFRVWKQSQEYRKSLRGLVNRMELEGSNNVLMIARGKYDPVQSGNSTLAFAKFVADSGCRFAPAKPGGEAAYANLQRQLLQLQAILED